jgi:hypothetical protein
MPDLLERLKTALGDRTVIITNVCMESPRSILLLDSYGKLRPRWHQAARKEC